MTWQPRFHGIAFHANFRAFWSTCLDGSQKLSQQPEDGLRGLDFWEAARANFRYAESGYPTLPNRPTFHKVPELVTCGKHGLFLPLIRALCTYIYTIRIQCARGASRKPAISRCLTCQEKSAIYSHPGHPDLNETTTAG